MSATDLANSEPAFTLPDDPRLSAYATFHERVIASGYWHERELPLDYSKVLDLDLFTLLSHSAAYGLLPMRDLVPFITWCARGLDVYQHVQSEAIVLVLYTGDSTATFAACSFPTGLAPLEELNVTIDAKNLVVELGLWTGKLRCPPAGRTFVRMTDIEGISKKLVEALNTNRKSLTLINAHDSTHRPTSVAYTDLLSFARAELAKEDGLVQSVRVFRFKEDRLATEIAVHYKDSLCVSRAAQASKDSPLLHAPGHLEELSGDEAEHQLERSRLLYTERVTSDLSASTIGVAPPAVQAELVRLTAMSRFYEHCEYLRSKKGLTEAILRGCEHYELEPSYYVLKHEEHDVALLIGGVDLYNIYVYGTDSAIHSARLDLNLIASEGLEAVENAGFIHFQGEARIAMVKQLEELLAAREIQCTELEPAVGATIN